jgi:hypothetical protein
MIIGKLDDNCHIAIVSLKNWFSPANLDLV